MTAEFAVANTEKNDREYLKAFFKDARATSPFTLVNIRNKNEYTEEEHEKLITKIYLLFLNVGL